MKKISCSLRVKQEFIQLVKDGIFLEGHKLPSETAMARRFGVSRETWRNSLELLRRDGIIYSKHGSGTYLARQFKESHSDLSQLSPISDMIKQSGIISDRILYNIFFSYPDKAIYNILQLDYNYKICTIKRHHLLNDDVISTSIIYMPECFADEIDQNCIPTSIFEYLESKKGIYITRSCTDIIIPQEDDAIVNHFFKDKNIPTMCLKQLHYDSKGNSIIYSIDYLRCDLLNLSVTRLRVK